MKLIQLNLRAYGPFTNKTLDFDKPPGVSRQNPGLHLILGPNESGKSTALRALRAALFGMDDTRDAHLHPKDMLRVGLKLQTGAGEVLDVERRKGKGMKSLVFSASDKPVPVEEWTRVLPVGNAKLFEDMFGLNYDRLVAGGRSLAAFEGEAGKALLAAAGDTGQIATLIRRMQERAEQIYTPRATSSKLQKALAAYKSAEQIVRCARYTSRDYKLALARRDEVIRELAQINTDLRARAEELNRLTRIHSAAPHVHRLLQDDESLKALAAIRVLAEDFESRFDAVRSALNADIERERNATIELERLAQELSSIPCDTLLAALLSEIDQLKDSSGKVQSIRADLPKDQGMWISLNTQLSVLSEKLGIPASKIPRILVERRRRIDLLSARYAVLENAKTQLPPKVAGLETRIRIAEAALLRVPESIDSTELARNLAQIRARKPPETELRRLRMERDQFVERFSRDLASLPLWHGSADQLAGLRVPLAATVAEFADRFVHYHSRHQQLIAEGDKLGFELESCRLAIGALESNSSIPSETDLSSNRRHREKLWHAIREKWLDGVRGERQESEIYESAVSSADSVGDRLRQEADRVEQKRSLELNQDATKRYLANHQQLLAKHIANGGDLQADWISLWKDASINPLSPSEMHSWLERRAELVNQSRDLVRVNGVVAEAEEDLNVCCSCLAGLLGVATNRSLTELVGKAELRVKEATDASTKRSEISRNIEQLRSTLKEAQDEYHRNQSDFAKWQGEWKNAIEGLPVTSSADPSSVKAVLGIADQVFSTSEEMNKLQHRIDAANSEISRYVQEVRDLAVRAGQTQLVDVDPLIAIGKLQELARTALTNKIRIAELLKTKLREEQNLATAKVAILANKSRLEELRLEALAPEVNLVQSAIEASKQKRELLRSILGNRDALATSCANITLDQLIAQVKQSNLDQLPAELERIREEINSLSDAKATHTSERDRIDSEFKIRENDMKFSAASFEKQSYAAQIDALTGEYLELQIRIKLLSEAIAVHRERNQDPILKRAGEYFHTLTRGAFSSITIDEDANNNRVLKGLRSLTSVHLDVDEMSDGTRDQLFLSLRLAFIENYCNKSAVCPVILDDVLLAFDASRTAATLHALRDLSKKTQVLVFTHDEHLVTLANDELGAQEYQLHRLCNLGGESQTQSFRVA